MQSARILQLVAVSSLLCFAPAVAVQETDEQPDTESAPTPTLVPETPEAARCALAEQQINRVVQQAERAVREAVEEAFFDALRPSPDVWFSEAPSQWMTDISPGQPLYTPLGSWLELDVPESVGIELPFQADGPGVLTFAVWSEQSPVRFAVEVLNEKGDYLVARHGGPRQGSGSVLSSIHESGAYRLRLRVPAGSIAISVEWLAFDALPAGEVVVETRPKAEERTKLLADQKQTIKLTPDQPAWLELAPDSSGQAIVDCSTAGGDVRLLLFVGDFSAPRLAFDENLQQNPGREVASFPVQPGQSYYLKVESTNVGEGELTIHTTIIPEPTFDGEE